MNFNSLQFVFRRLLFAILLLCIAAPLFASDSQYELYTPTWLMKPPGEEDSVMLDGLHYNRIDDSVTVTFSDGIEVVRGKTQYHIIDTTISKNGNRIVIPPSPIFFRIKTMGCHEINVYYRSLLPDTAYVTDTIQDKKSSQLGKKTFTLYLYACPGHVTQYRSEIDREIAIMDSTAFPYVHTPIHRFAMWNDYYWMQRRIHGQPSLLLNHSIAYVLYTLDLLNYDSLKFDSLNESKLLNKIAQSFVSSSIDNFFVYAPPRLDLVDTLVKLDFANDSLTNEQYTKMVATVKRQMWELYLLDYKTCCVLPLQKESAKPSSIRAYHLSREKYLYEQVLERRAIVAGTTKAVLLK